MKAVFLDLHGTVTVGIPKYERVTTVDQVELLPHTMEALTLLAALGYVVL